LFHRLKYIRMNGHRSLPKISQRIERRKAEKVGIIRTDTEDIRLVEDVLWTDEYYQLTFRKARLESVTIHKPLAKENEPYGWINETNVAPWVIYVLKKQENGRAPGS